MPKLRASYWVVLLFAALAALAMFQKRRWKPLEVFDYDPGGYYVYLPSVFIYHDLASADSLVALKHTYSPHGDMNIGLVPLSQGGCITKYSLGVALAELPWFLGGHLYAGWADYPQDGFSRPYQQIISVAGLVHALLGLYVLTLLLRYYFDERITAWTIAAVALGTNLLCYASVEPATAHAPLFMWQASLLYCTARWYKAPRRGWALGIGLFLGLAVLTRPTEILYVVVPLLWGISLGRDVATRGHFLWQQRRSVLVAIVGFAAVVSLQMFFWKAVSGQWFFYTYQNERFTFAHPYLLEGLFSFRKGWLLYTPIAGVALVGIVTLRRYLPVAWLPVLLSTLVVVYVTFSWEQWWYGGSFGARPLISLYPLLALALASLLQHSQAVAKWPLLRTVLLLLIVLNLWQTRQYSTGAITWDGTTRERYFSKFFALKP